MNARIWGIIGGITLVLALLSPLVLGSAKKVERLFEAAEALYEREDYERAITKYKEALKEANKFGAKTEVIDKDFTTFANLKIARCYYEMAEKTSDVRYYQPALTHIKKVWLKAHAAKHQEELTYLWAETLYKTDDLEQAKSKFDQLVENFPNSPWVPRAWYVIGKINLKQENYSEALNTFQKLIAEFPRSEFREEAERCIEEIYDAYLVPIYPDRKIQPDPNDELFPKARRLRKEKRWVEAAEIYERLANSVLPAEDTAEALYWAGCCYHEATRTDAELFSKSVDAFKRLIGDYGDNPKCIEVFYRLALVYTDWAQKSGDSSKWLSVIDTVEEANTKYADSDDATVQGWMSRMQELKEEASQKVVPYPIPEPEPIPEPPEPIPEPPEPIPEPPEPIPRKRYYVDEGRRHLKQGELAVAAEKARQALNLDRNYLPAHELLSEIKRYYVDEGRRHLKQGELAVAAEKARQALNLDRNYPPAHELLSEIKEKHYGRGWTFFDEKQYEDAIAEFKNAIKIDSNFKKAHWYLGVIYIKQEKYIEAIKVLEAAINIDKGFKEAYFNIAIAHIKLGEFEAAANAAKAALKLDPNYEPARSLIELITD